MNEVIAASEAMHAALEIGKAWREAEAKAQREIAERLDAISQKHGIRRPLQNVTYDLVIDP